MTSSPVGNKLMEDNMQLSDYMYANKYIKDCQREFGELRRLAGTVSRYASIVTNISAVFRLDKVQHSNENIFENAMANKIDAQDDLNRQWSRCIHVCSALKMVEDADGASVIYYYYFMKMKMVEVAEEIGISKRSCWRHHNVAIEQLNSCLQRNR